LILRDTQPGLESHVVLIPNNFLDIFGEAKKSLGVLINKKKFLFLIFFIFLILFLMLIRLFYLQIGRGTYYRSIADGNRIRVERIQPQRGIIYDVNLNPLLKNSPNFSLQVMPIDLPEDEQEFLKLENLLSQKLGEKINLKEYVSENVLENFQPRIVKESLDYEQAMDLLILSENLRGVSIRIGNKREYLYGGYFSHVLGYTGKVGKEDLEKNSDYLMTDNVGKTGVEKYWEEDLRGYSGSVYVCKLQISKYRK